MPHRHKFRYVETCVLGDLFKCQYEWCGVLALDDGSSKAGAVVQYCERCSEGWALAFINGEFVCKEHEEHEKSVAQ